MCNLLVVSGSTYHFIKKGHFNKTLTLPFVLSSVPLAFIGGLFPITEKLFFILLTATLTLCGLRILFLRDKSIEEIKTPSVLVAMLTGGTLGLLSGLVGIGGGIFLSPILINMGWARSKDASAVAAIFIMLNSLAGLGGQFLKSTSMPEIDLLLPLFLSVIIGGQIGSRIGTHEKVSYNLIQKGTGVLTLFISLRLLLKHL